MHVSGHSRTRRLSEQGEDYEGHTHAPDFCQLGLGRRNGGGTGPGNPFYVASSPGQIQDTVVIYTGAGGVGVTTNTAGFEDAYGTPNGSAPTYASMNGAINIVDPGSKAGIANPTSNTWDANLLSLKGFLGGGLTTFLFNNNDTNSDQNLAIWAKLWLTDGNNQLYNNRYLYLSNENAVYGLGGTLNGDASLYNPGNVEPAINTNTFETDYILSGGTVCFDASWTVLPCNSNPAPAHTINHNLGANQAAYAGILPVLNDWLDTLFTLTDNDLSQYTMHLDLRLGCAPAWQGNCDNIKIDNGYEQLFLVATNPPDHHETPEPGTFALLGLGTLVLLARCRYVQRAG